MSTLAKPRFMQVISKLVLTALCALCLQSFCGCAAESGDEGIIDHAARYTYARVYFDLAVSSVLYTLPDAELEIEVLGVKDTPSGVKEIELEPVIVSDTMASWGADEWAANQDDLFFNLPVHFTHICKQAHELGDLPEGYELTCPDYAVVYDSQKSVGFIIASDGIYQKTDDPENPIGEAIVLTRQE